MKRRTFRVTECDACGHRFRRQPPEKVYMMAFRPTGADFEVAYALCRTCYPQIPGNMELLAHALNRAADRCPEYVEYSRAAMLECCQAEGTA
ncbi:MAG: hypothetical protein ACREPS_08515 [Rhodanobacteraceae bacterium]